MTLAECLGQFSNDCLMLDHVSGKNRTVAEIRKGGHLNEDGFRVVEQRFGYERMVRRAIVFHGMTAFSEV